MFGIRPKFFGWYIGKVLRLARRVGAVALSGQALISRQLDGWGVEAYAEMMPVGEFNPVDLAVGDGLELDEPVRPGYAFLYLNSVSQQSVRLALIPR